MLQILRYANPKQLHPLFEGLDPFKETLIISHLRTKLEIHDILLQAKGFVVDESLLRISEFSENLFKRVCPQFKILQRDLAEVKIKNFLKKEFATLAVDPELAPSLLEFVEFMGNFLCFPEPRKQIQDWFKENPEAELRWKKWFLVGGLICDMLQSEGKVLRPWLAAYLVEKNRSWKNIWPRRLWVDLRTDITWSEAELFLRLAKEVDVVVLVPKLNDLPPASPTRKIYEYLTGFVGTEKLPETLLASETPHSLSVETCKVSGGLAEVRLAVKTVRDWLEGGVPPQKIAVVAPQIEDYWPMLEAYFRKEGIPVRKKVSLRFSSFPSVQKWIAKHHLLLKSLSSSYLEAMLFHPEEESLISFEDFSKLYSRIYDLSHFTRNEKVFQKLAELPNLDQRKEKSLSRDEFVGLSLSLWSFNEDPEALVHTLKDYVASMEGKEVLPLQDHVHLLEKLLSRKEKTLIEEQDGITLTSIGSGHALDLTHKVYLGLLKENFKNRFPPLISLRDIQLLQKDLGFHIEDPEEEKASLELQLQKNEDMYLQKSLWICPATNLAGETGTPHPLWIGMEQAQPRIEALVKGQTVWDFWQKEWSLEIEVNKEKPLQDIELPNEIKLSPSSVRDLLECPFIFVARKIFKLEDPDWVDVETPASVWGQIQHHLVEQILSKDLNYWNETELIKCIDIVLGEHKLAVSDKALFQPLKEKLLKLGLRFVEVEKNWKKEHPELSGQEFEKKWSKEIAGPENEKFVFHGVIDRVDYFPDGALIFDYKTSKAQVSNHASWIAKDQLQLLFYEWGLATKTLGALFYVLKDLSKDKGFILKDSPVMPKDISSKALIDEGDLAELHNEFQNKLQTVMTMVREKNLYAQPSDKTSCTDCSWRKTCRAQHLVKI